jgi:competence protein ComEA
MKQVAYVLIGLLVGFILAGALFLVARLPDGEPVALEPSPTKVSIEVQVLGGVVHPGVYSFPEGSRVQDAITAAGGLLAGIDPNSINLVAKLQDGQQVNIAGGTGSSSGESPDNPFSVVPSSNNPFSVIPTSNLPFTVISTPVGSTVTPNLININTAALGELDTLPGIGPTTAQKIIDYRNQHGPFGSITEIMNVAGIGPSTFDLIQGLISVK